MGKGGCSVPCKLPLQFSLQGQNRCGWYEIEKALTVLCGSTHTAPCRALQVAEADAAGLDAGGQLVESLRDSCNFQHFERTAPLPRTPQVAEADAAGLDAGGQLVESLRDDLAQRSLLVGQLQVGLYCALSVC